MRNIMIVLLFCLLVQGCGMHEFQSGDPLIGLEQSRQATEAACWNAQRQPIYPADMSDMAVAMIEQQKAFTQIIGAITGKQVGPCGGGTNLNDVLIADVRERNESLREIGGGAIGTVKLIGGIWAAGSLLDKATGNAGHNTTTNTETTTIDNAGDGSVSYTGDTTTTTETTTVTTDMSEVEN